MFIFLLVMVNDLPYSVVSENILDDRHGEVVVYNLANREVVGTYPYNTCRESMMNVGCYAEAEDKISMLMKKNELQKDGMKKRNITGLSSIPLHVNGQNVFM